MLSATFGEQPMGLVTRPRAPGGTTPLRRRRFGAARGMTLIEVLVAALVIAVSLAATVSLWQFAYNITGQTDDTGTAYSIGRRAIEKIRQTGFRQTPIGTAQQVGDSDPAVYTATYTAVAYYDRDGSAESVSQTATSLYQATTTVTTTYAIQAPSASGAIYVPADDAVRSVTVTVAALSTGATVCRMGTLLVRSGV